MERKIPKSAVKPLTEYCSKLSEETGRSTAEILKEYLELMNKYADFFYDGAWPLERDKHYGLRDKEEEFLEKAENWEEKCQRFTLFCLKRNISLEGFDSEGFTNDFEFYGEKACYDCSVPVAMRLRKDVKYEEELIREIEEEMKMEEPSEYTKEMYDHYKKPDVVKIDKMRVVELKLYEEVGRAKGKSCEVKNEYKCPYRDASKKLCKDGGLIKRLWREMRWYNRYLKRLRDESSGDTQFKKESQDDESTMFIDMTSFEDITEAFGDGRFDKIIDEHMKYMEETGREVWEE